MYWQRSRRLETPRQGLGVANHAAAEGAVTVVIVNFRTPHLTESAARSALAQPETALVVIVDNCSADESVEFLRRAFSSESRISILESNRNVGFGAGNNHATRSARTPFLFLLNSDAVLHPGALAALLSCWGTVDRPGALAPVVFCADGKTKQKDAVGRFPTPFRLISRRLAVADDCTQPDYVSGCAILVDRMKFESLGGFDERFFMYFEDVDLCRRLRDDRLTIHRCPSAAVTHLGGQSYRRRGPQKADYVTAQDLLLRKHGAGSVAMLAVRLARGAQRALPWRNHA